MNVLNFNLIILISIPSSWHGSSTSYSCNCSHRYRSDLIPSFLSHWIERVSKIACEIRLQTGSEIRYGCVDYTIEHIRIWLVHIWVKVIEGLQKKNKFSYCPKCCSCQLFIISLIVDTRLKYFIFTLFPRSSSNIEFLMISKYMRPSSWNPPREVAILK